MTRRRISTILATLLLAVGSLTPPAAAATLIKLATLVPDGSVWDRALKQMGEDWQKASGGQVSLRIYPGGVAGDDSDIVRKMRIGQLQAGALTVAGLSGIDESFNALAIPLFFDSYEELAYVLDQVGPELERRLEAKGFVLINWGHGGWAHLFSKQPVRSIADLKRQKLFTWAGDQRMVDWWKENGFEPVPLAMTDILPGLQTGMIDAFPTTPLAALSLQYFRQASNMLDLGLAPLVGATVATRASWEGLPEALRAVLLDSARQAGERLQQEVPEQDATAVKEMVGRGLTVTEPSDRAEWVREGARFAETMRAAMVPADIFDQVKTARDTFRQRQAAAGTPGR